MTAANRYSKLTDTNRSFGWCDFTIPNMSICSVDCESESSLFSQALNPARLDFSDENELRVALDDLTKSGVLHYIFALYCVCF